MKSEQLIAKKVKHHFSAAENQVLFDVNSLEDHYDGLLIHASDVIYLEEGELVNGYVKVGDVNMDDAVSKEFVEDTVSETIYQGGMENPFEWKDGIVDSEAVLKIEVTAETLNDNPELVAEGIVVGETITVDTVELEEVKNEYVFASMPTDEIIPEKVVKKKKVIN
jgi:hypothetical protein